MQKRKNLKCFQKILFSVCTFFSVFLIFSCKSPVQLEQVEPLKLIDGGSPVIVYIPVSASKTFVEYAMTDFFDFSQKNVQSIVSRMENIALALDSDEKIQIAVEGSFPKAGIKMAFSEKKGWNTQIIKGTNFPFAVYSSASVPFKVAFPDSKTFVASENVSKMLARYESEHNIFEFGENGKNSQDSLPDEIYDFLTDNNASQIRFYSQNPGNLFGKIVGKTINLGLKSLSGSLEASKAEEKFALVLNLELSNPAIAKAAVKMLKVALFPIPAKIVQKGASQIQLSDISLSYNQLGKILRQ